MEPELPDVFKSLSETSPQGLTRLRLFAAEDPAGLTANGRGIFKEQCRLQSRSSLRPQKPCRISPPAGDKSHLAPLRPCWARIVRAVPS